MKILLIAPYFYPDEPVGAARWNRLTKYLIKYDCEIYVIASDMLSSSTESVLCKRLVRVSYQSSFLDRLLIKVSGAKKGLGVEKERQSTSHYQKKGKVKLYSWLIETIGRIIRFPGPYWWSSQEMVKEGLSLIEKEKIEIIIATHPFATSLRAANILSKKSKIPWIADMRDGWSSYYYGEYKHGTFFYIALRILEKYYLQSASRVVVINKSLSSSIATNPDNIEVLHNVYDSEVSYSLPLVSKNNTINFAFAGSVHKNHCWDIFFEALLNFPVEIELGNIHVDYYGGSFNVVLEKIHRWGINENLVVNHGYLDKQYLISNLATADILLVFGFSGTFGDTVTTGKIFDYIEIGKPIVVIGPNTSELAKMVIKTGVGVVLSNVDDVANYIRQLLDNYDGAIVNQIAKKNQIELDKYSAEHVAIKYLEVLSQALAKN